MELLARNATVNELAICWYVWFMDQIRRKAWLFSDTPKGASASAQIYSLVETAKINGQEPYTWLRHVLERLPHASTVEDYEALLPWNCSPETPGKRTAHLAVGVLHGSDTSDNG